MTKLTDDQMQKVVSFIAEHYKELDERLLAFAFIASEDFDAYVEAFEKDSKQELGARWAKSNAIIIPKLENWMGVWIALTSVLEIYE